MENEHQNSPRAIANRVIEMAEEFESSGEASVEEAELKASREALHKWVDSIVGVVAMPGFARVALIHENGRQSTISSWDLCLELSLLKNRQ